MALNQMYAVTGRKHDPNLVSIINAQTPYLMSMKRQQAEDDLTKRGFALKEQELTQNEQLAREEMEQNQKQTRKANALAIANFGLKGGLGAYENIPEFKGVVDKAIGGVKGLFSETPAPSGAASYLGDAFETGGAIDWMEKLDLSQFLPTEKLVSGMGEVLGGSFADMGGDIYSGAVSTAIDEMTSGIDWSGWDLF